MAYIKPQTLVFQEFITVPAATGSVLRAHISGPNTNLHRYNDITEKAGISSGYYDHTTDTVHVWPSKTPGSLVNNARVRVFIEDALLLYFEDTIGNEAGGRGITTVVADYPNRVMSSTVNFISSGDYARSPLLKDRDVRIGDVVHIRGVDDTSVECTEAGLWTKVAGFAAELDQAIVDEAVVGTSNKKDSVEDAVINQTAGPYNCISAEADGTEYSGLESGRVTETYTVTVVKSGISGCSAARLRVVSASGTDNATEVIPEDFGMPTPIGTRGLTMTFLEDDGQQCSTSASIQGVDSDQLIVGQTWVITVTQAYTAICAFSGGDYTGGSDDTYIVEVTRGGTWAELPQVTTTTTRGLDSSGPTIVTNKDVAVPVGSYGLTITFEDCASGDSVGLVTGDKFYITVASGLNGPVRTLILQDSLPDILREAADLDLRLFIPKTIEVTQTRLNAPPSLNYTIEPTQIVLNAGVTAYDATWTLNGVGQPLQVWSGREADNTGPEYGQVYIEYHEYLTELTRSVTFIDGPAALDLIPGPLDPANPLKWGVFKAVQNSNGTTVACTAVADPNDVEAWQDVLVAVDGRDDIYNLVPLTRNRTVLDLFQAQVVTESTPERGNWKAMFLSLAAAPSQMVVGKSGAVQLRKPTSVDGDVVMATLSDNPQATGTQYTMLTVPANNSGFITYGVKGGDIVRYLYSIDAFGQTTYAEFIVDVVISENTIRLLSGHTTAVDVPQKMEIHHSRTKDEIADDLVETAQSFSNPRVVAVWPDIVGSAGITQQGYFLCAALAGLASGVVSQQGLTNVEIAGFDDLASRSRDFFSRAQLDKMAAGGIWIATEDRNGTPHTRHALTTSIIDLNRSEEMIRRNLDAISYVYQAGLAPLIGRSNASPAILGRVEYIIDAITAELMRTYIATLGGKLISASIATDGDGFPMLYIHPLAADRVEVVLNVVLPAPLNVIALHIVV